MDELEQLGQELANDPAIKEALSEHEAACAEEDEDNCIVCQTSKALESLTFVIHTLNSQTCDCESCAVEAVSELDIAEHLVDDLSSALQLINICQRAISLLSAISHATTFIISQNELGEDEDEDDGENR